MDQNPEHAHELTTVNKTDNELILEAVKELTKEVGALRAEWTKWRTAGKF